MSELTKTVRLKELSDKADRQRNAAEESACVALSMLSNLMHGPNFENADSEVFDEIEKHVLSLRRHQTEMNATKRAIHALVAGR